MGTLVTCVSSSSQLLCGAWCCSEGATCGWQDFTLKKASQEVSRLTAVPSMGFKVLEPVIEGEFSVTKWDNNTILELCGSYIFWASDTWCNRSKSLHLRQLEIRGLRM